MQFFKKTFLKTITVAAGSAVLVGGCASDPKPSFDAVQKMAKDRTGKQIEWNRENGENASIRQTVDSILKHDLTVDSAVQIALLNNRTLQSEFEAIGLSHAEMVQAGLLKNPQFFASWRFPNRSPSGTDTEYSVTEDFLDLILLPLRKKVAAQQLEQTEFQVTQAVIDLAAETKKSFYMMQARQQFLNQLQLIGESTTAAAELSQRQHEAGTINELEMVNQQAISGQTQVDFLQTQQQIQSDREHLNRLMGLWGKNLSWKISAALPEIPASEISFTRIESYAISNRLDLKAAQARTAAASRALKLKSNLRYAPAHVDIGIDTEQTPDHQRVTGPTIDLDLPVFDQGQGEIGRLEARYRQARRQTEALAIDIRSEVREAVSHLQADRDLAHYFGDTLLPQRIKLVELTQQHYNAMLKGVYELLLAKQSEISTRRAAAEAWRDYWIAHAELERAVGGVLPASVMSVEKTSVPQPAAAETTEPVQHHHHE